MYAVTLRLSSALRSDDQSTPIDTGDAALVLVNVQLLKKTPLPPFGALCNPRTTEFLSLIDPAWKR